MTITVFVVTSCNHLFYHPHANIYLTPKKIDLEYLETTVPSSDGVQLQAWKIPAENPPKHKTAIIQFHGNAENRSTHFLSVAWLAPRGVDVVVFDYRGYDGSTGTPSRHGVVEDGVAMLKWFQREYPNSRRFVIGQSLGGAVAITSLAKSGAKIDGLILESTFSSYRGVARQVLARHWLTWPFQWLPWILLSGDEDPEDYINQIKVPILAYHDRRDPVVPYAAGESLYQKLPSDQITLRSFDGNKHTQAFASDRKDEIDALLKFLNVK
jgi:hypothetical protein